MQDLPMEVATQIVGHLTATSVSPMDDLRSLGATCCFPRGVTSDRTVGQRINVRRFAAAMLWRDRAAYAALLADLTDIGNLEACYMTGMMNVFSKGTPEARPCIIELAHATERGHNVAAYVAAILLFRANTGADDNQAVRQYKRQVEGVEEVVAGAAGGAGRSMFSNEGCLHCRELAFACVMGTHWRRWVQVPQLASPVPRGDLRCAGFPCSHPVDEWDPDGLRQFCSEDYMIQHEVNLLFKGFGY
ncbi:hypothetical protein PVAP13_7KG378600 [Panicum virgatum]|uniref:At2g35280-like TPR domain-containing protein n=2 Tax=Panicum virgatum TaxID=38727 RepID=A0A8T0QF84_PANVG|nr:hypothetical protein PVAP13_7KG378600 [Panicum virgatum]